MFLRFILRNIKWITWIYLLILVLGSVLPLNSGTSLNNTYIVEVRSDYLLHVFVLLPLAVLVGLTLHGVYGISGLSGLWWRVVLFGLLVVVFCEGIQLLVPYRAFNINDMFANGIGALIGLIPAWMLWRADSKQG